MHLFKNRGHLPDLKSQAEPNTPVISSQDELPRIPRYVNRHGSRQGNLVWSAIAAVLALLIVVLSAPLWLHLLRSVVPDRYIMAYAPEPVQGMVFRIDVSEQVPAPDVEPVEPGVAADLLLDTANLPTPTPTPSPSPEQVVAVPGGEPGGSAGGGSGSGGYVQPTRVAIAPTPTFTPAPAAALDPRAVDRDNQADLASADNLLTGFNFVQQTGVNNCGPASIATMMSYWGQDFTLEEARGILKPNPDDPNVRPDEMVTFANSMGYEMLVREGGDYDILKKFVLAGYPVLIETGYDPEPQTIGWTSHYLTIAGFSDDQGGLIAMDTYRRPNWFYQYEEIDLLWRQFNRRYLIAYRPDQAVAVASILGEHMDDQTMYEDALYTAQYELSLDRNDPYAWFNVGTNLVGLGRYEEAALAFDQARRKGLPWRFMWYQFTPFEAYLQVGRTSDVHTLADAVLEKIASEEPFYYKGMAYLQEGDEEGARRQFNMALRFNRNYTAAQEALASLDSQG